MYYKKNLYSSQIWCDFLNIDYLKNKVKNGLVLIIS